MEFGKFIAHRGLHGGGIPENSMLAFEKAIAEGLPIELDVWLTKDAKVVVHHDKSLSRMCGADRLIKDMTYDELRHYTLGGTDQRIQDRGAKACQERIKYVSKQCGHMARRQYRSICRSCGYSWIFISDGRIHIKSAPEGALFL